MKEIKYYILISVVLSCFFFSCKESGTESEYRAVLEDYLTKFEKHDYDYCYSILSDKYKMDFIKENKYDYLEFNKTNDKIGEQKNFDFKIESVIKHNKFIVVNNVHSIDSEDDSERRLVAQYLLIMKNNKIYIDEIKYIKWQVNKDGIWNDYRKNEE